MATTSTGKTGADGGWRATDVPIALAVGPLLFLIWMCLRFFVDVPYGDQWELVPRLNHMDAGLLSLADVWGQHNEHRPMFPLLIMLGLAWLTGWNIAAEIVVNLLLGTLILTIAAAAVREVVKVHGAWAWWLLPVASLLVLSPGQFENWLWGWQIQLLLGVLAGLSAAWWLADPSGSRVCFALAVIAAIVGTYSFASGLTFWTVGILGVWLMPAQRTWPRAAIWIAVGVATIASYFVDYHFNPGHPPVSSNLASSAAIMRLAMYVAEYLGSPVAVYHGAWAAVAGAFGLGIFVWLVFRGRTASCRRVFVFACLAGLNAIAGALLSGLGRAGFGSDQALTSRYQTIAAPLWLAICLLAVLPTPAVAAVPAARTRLLLILGAVALSLMVILTGQAGVTQAQARMRLLAPLRVALYGRWNWEYAARLYLNDVRAVKERAAVLRMLQMSVYRDGR